MYDTCSKYDQALIRSIGEGENVITRLTQVDWGRQSFL